MELEMDNIRAVLQRYLQHGASPRGLDLACSLGWYWITRATSEGVRWLDALLVSGGSTPATAGWSYFLRGFLAVLQGDAAAARPPLERAVAVARAAGLRSVLSQSLCMASIAANMAGDREASRRLLDEVPAITEDLDDVAAMVGFLQAQALNALFDGDHGTVRAAAAEGVRLSREAGDLYSLEMMLMNMGSAALMAGDPSQARPLFAEALRIGSEIDDRVAQYYLITMFAYLAAGSGRGQLAAQLLGASESVRTGVGAIPIGILVPYLAQAEESAVAVLGAARFEAEFEAGKRLGRDTAIRIALGKPANAAAGTPGDASAAPLGKREAEVARLVADGLSNKQIGARLFISERTVDSHVRNILNKLGFNSRAQIAGWMASLNQ
jgi:DNA-binding CsgD family transcriptional regulator